MKKIENSIFAVLLNMIQFNVFYQACYIIDGETLPIIIVFVLLVLYTLIYREIVRKILKLTMKEYYKCYSIGFVLYGMLFVFSGDIWKSIELLICLQLIIYTNLISFGISYMYGKLIKKTNKQIKKKKREK